MMIPREWLAFFLLESVRFIFVSSCSPCFRNSGNKGTIKPHLKPACKVSTNKDITNPSMLILRPEGGIANDAFYLPDEDGDIIHIPTGEPVYLSCGRTNFRINAKNAKVKGVNATCVRRNVFNVLNQEVQFSALSCSKYPAHYAKFNGNSCLGKHHEFNIGYEINGNNIVLMTGCFDKNLQNTLYTAMELIPNVKGAQVDFPQPEWTEDNFYDLARNNLNVLYTRKRQRTTINKLLGLRSNAQKYVHGTNDFYLIRGHLSAKDDFVFGTQQRATFYLINAAPQWQTVNQGNWAQLGVNIRNQVIKTGRTFLIYTGTYGISTLPHNRSKKRIKLFLFVGGKKKQAIPVPQLLWKAAYDPISRAGVVFLTLNNPYLSDTTALSQIICRNVCDKISWLTWSPTNITLGYSYCCTVQSFRKATDFLPDLDVSSLLT